MTPALKISSFFLVALVVFIACNKDPVNPNPSRPTNPVNPINPGVANKPPVANAGADTTIYYDLQNCRIDSVELDARSSTDQDGKVIAFYWQGAGLLSKPDSSNIRVRPLSTGQHQFVLSVADDQGGTDRDTMIVNVVSRMNRPVINAQLIPFATLSQLRQGVSVGAAGSKIVFAGGGQSSRVDIYDINTNSWSMAELSVARQDFVVVTSGNKIFFAGGWEGSWWDFPVMFTNVDIYDVATNTWSVKHLSEPRAWIGAASAGSKVFFAGGVGGPDNNWQASSRVDIYDTETNSWTTSELSAPRSNLSAELAGDKIYFAGGARQPSWTPQATVDVYDINTGLWSVSSMSEPKYRMKSYAIGSKIIWAGGSTSTNTYYWGSYTSLMVEIKDVTTQSSTFSCLFEPKSWWDNDQKAVLKNNQIVFFTGGGAANKFDIYDIGNNSWSIGELDRTIAGASLIAVNNTIYVAGGYLNGFPSNIVWKLEF